MDSSSIPPLNSRGPWRHCRGVPLRFRPWVPLPPLFSAPVSGKDYTPRCFLRHVRMRHAKCSCWSGASGHARASAGANGLRPMNSRRPSTMDKAVRPLRVGFILTNNFTLTALSNFVDVLRLAADDGDNSRPIRCQWHIMSDSDEPVRSSSGLLVVSDLPDSSTRQQLDYVVVVGGLLHRGPQIDDKTRKYLLAAADTKRRPDRRLHRKFRAVAAGPSAAEEVLHQLVSLSRFSRGIRRNASRSPTSSSSSTASASPVRAGSASPILPVTSSSFAWDCPARRRRFTSCRSTG